MCVNDMRCESIRLFYVEIKRRFYNKIRNIVSLQRPSFSSSTHQPISIDHPCGIFLISLSKRILGGRLYLSPKICSSTVGMVPSTPYFHTYACTVCLYDIEWSSDLVPCRIRRGATCPPQNQAPFAQIRVSTRLMWISPMPRSSTPSRRICLQIAPCSGIVGHGSKPCPQNLLGKDSFHFYWCYFVSFLQKYVCYLNICYLRGSVVVGLLRMVCRLFDSIRFDSAHSALL